MIRGHDLGQTKNTAAYTFSFPAAVLLSGGSVCLSLLSLNTEEFRLAQLWPLAFGALWAAILSGFVRLFPAKAGRVVYGILYFVAAIYAAVQTGYFYLFSEMMWLSDFRYASEGSDYFPSC